MNNKIKYILSIAGFDPSGGAGVLADIKVFEQYELIGFGVITSITHQNEKTFSGVKWLPLDEIIHQIEPLTSYPIEIIKIGLIENLKVLKDLIVKLKNIFPKSKIVWDPILKASAGYEFHQNIDQNLLNNVLKNIFLITPNFEEAEKLGKEDAIQNALTLSQNSYVVLKGGHHPYHANDGLYFHGKLTEEIKSKRIPGGEKHGSGCVFSSALAANLALGREISEAFGEAKEYTQEFLASNETLLGQHHKPLFAG